MADERRDNSEYKFQQFGEIVKSITYDQWDLDKCKFINGVELRDIFQHINPGYLLRQLAPYFTAQDGKVVKEGLYEKVITLQTRKPRDREDEKVLYGKDEKEHELWCYFVHAKKILNAHDPTNAFLKNNWKAGDGFVQKTSDEDELHITIRFDPKKPPVDDHSTENPEPSSHPSERRRSSAPSSAHRRPHESERHRSRQRFSRPPSPTSNDDADEYYHSDDGTHEDEAWRRPRYPPRYRRERDYRPKEHDYERYRESPRTRRVREDRYYSGHDRATYDEPGRQRSGRSRPDVPRPEPRRRDSQSYHDTPPPQWHAPHSSSRGYHEYQAWLHAPYKLSHPPTDRTRPAYTRNYDVDSADRRRPDHSHHAPESRRRDYDQGYERRY